MVPALLGIAHSRFEYRVTNSLPCKLRVGLVCPDATDVACCDGVLKPAANLFLGKVCWASGGITAELWDASWAESVLVFRTPKVKRQRRPVSQGPRREAALHDLCGAADVA